MQMLIEASACLNSDLKNILQTQQHHFIPQLFELFYPNYKKIIPHIMVMQLQNDREAAQYLQEKHIITMSYEEHNTRFASCHDFWIIPGKITFIKYKQINNAEVNLEKKTAYNYK